MVDTLHPPESVIATWPKPNYIDPQSRGPALEYVCIIFAAVGTATVTARIYSRLFITKAPGFDDLLIVLALLFLIALSVLVAIGNRVYFIGRHVWDIPIETFVGSRLNIWVSLWCFVAASTLIKVSVLLFYRRLSVKFSRAFLIATWVGIAYNVLYLVSFALGILLLYDPIHAYWKSFDPVWAATHHWHNGAEGVAVPASAAFSVLGDLYSTLLPLILVYNLDLPIRQKMALYVLFALGFMAVAAGLVRTVLLYRLLNVDYDFSWQLWVTWIWSLLELYLGLFAASAPGLKPFFRRIFVDSINSLAKNSRGRLGGSSGAQLDQKGTWVSETQTSKGHISVSMSVDVERIGMAYGGDDHNAREMGFLRDIEQDKTRHFELRASRDGKKIIPMQVFKQADGSTTPSVTANPFADEQAQSTSTPRTNWPMPPLTSNPPPRPRRSNEYLPSLVPQHPLHVGLHFDKSKQAEDGTRPPTRGGSVRAARLRAQEQQNSPSPSRGSGLNPRPFEDHHDGLGAGSKLESPSDTEDEVSIYNDDIAPYNRIVTSSSVQTRELSSSDETLHLPRMGSRSPDRRRATTTTTRGGIGYAA
ncbi:hypothetical protein EDD37DRAFT_222699 [Exophiala viscosa]|uniref:Rhodopsin domain-containing protein n=1 Tax=Exophiala viscosa TaxID=2486360 RepID=A0AAN6IGS0_9EURO|nr:hypothetical protein EDD36DRAFT_2962 [Exophiala viscosa]KAI1626619.1 hypothetical protein EDD37DRAFT_222699 [Exophiala viscosa]